MVVVKTISKFAIKYKQTNKHHRFLKINIYFLITKKFGCVKNLLPKFRELSFTTNFTRRGQIQVSSSSGSGFITIADADGGDYYSASADTPHYANITVIIPNNIYYKLVHIGGTDTMTVQSWVELR